MSEQLRQGPERIDSIQETIDDLEGAHGRTAAIEIAQNQVSAWHTVLAELKGQRFDIWFALKKAGLPEKDRERVAKVVIEHLALCGWKMERPERGLGPSFISKIEGPSGS